MELSMNNFRRDELVSLKLRALFEQRGFRRVRVNKFEEYALYVDNKNFLQSESIITFMDLSGKLLALKPDVTLSVVRNIPKKELKSLEKLYYVDEVYRLSRENSEYKVHNQVGIEMIGSHDDFTNIEAIDLALSSLALISESFVLDISHLGFVSGLLEQLNLTHDSRRQIMSAIHKKSPHDVATALDLAGADTTARNMVLALCGLHGNFFEVLPKAKDLVTCDQMKEAYIELERLATAMRGNRLADQLNLDFSVVNDLDYYNGLIFLGYVEGLPKVVLTGGRYDNLLHKMGKASGAVGFAVSLDDISTYFKSGKSFDFDILVTYLADADYSELLTQAKSLVSLGKSVRLESESSDLDLAGFTFEKRLNFKGNKLTEVQPC